MSALLSSILQMDRIADTQLLLLVNVLLVLLIVGFSAGIALALVRRSMRHRVDAERLAATGTATARILHQVKGPLQTIVLHTEMLEDDTLVADLDRRREVCQTVIGEAARMTELLEELSAYAAGVQRRLKPEPVPLATVITEAARSEIRGGERAGIDVRVGPLEAVTVHGDPYFLRQAIENVLRNALEALSDAKPTGSAQVTITLRRGKGEAVIEIRDNGPGIATHQAAHIFEPFVTTKGQGMGLGLPVAREIVESHGGRIDVRSNPGEGTSVMLALPCREGDAGVAPRASAHADESRVAWSS